MKTPVVSKGRIIIYRVFDAASEIRLTDIEGAAREGAKRLRLSKEPYMKALEFANPPLSFDLPSFGMALNGREVAAGVVGRAYDFGVVSVAFEIPVPSGTTLEELEGITRALDTDASIGAKASAYAKGLLESIGGAAVGPEIKEDFVEDYAVVFIERAGDGMKAEEFLASYDPSRLLFYETKELSQPQKAELFKHSFSYYDDDLVVLNTDNALILDPTGSHDLPDILEFANAQFVELRYYDNLIDRELASIYSTLARKKGASIFRLGEYERLARRITRAVAELTEVTERVNNALKVTEDVYYARVYKSFMNLLGCSDWETSIKEKLQIVSNTCQMLHDEISAKRTYVIELGILILIAIDIVLVLLLG